MLLAPSFGVKLTVCCFITPWGVAPSATCVLCGAVKTSGERSIGCAVAVQWLHGSRHSVVYGAVLVYNGPYSVAGMG